jgi:hypothetical protein
LKDEDIPTHLFYRPMLDREKSKELSNGWATPFLGETALKSPWPDHND